MISIKQENHIEMSNVIFLFENFNPNLRTTFFKHKGYTNYLGYSEYAIKNPNVDHRIIWENR